MKFRVNRAVKSSAASGTLNANEGGSISSRRQATQLTTGLRWVLGLFFSVFLLVGIFATYALGVRPLLDARAAKTWTPVKCRILSSEVRAHDGDSTTYSVDVAFAYEVGEREYRSERYDFTPGSSSGRQEKKEIVARYRVGMETICYVNPMKPTEAVLERERVRDWAFGFIPFVFALVGGGGVTFAIFGQRKSRSVTEATLMRSDVTFSRTSTARTVRREESFSDEALVEGPVELKPAVTRVGKVVAASIGAVFWNGIVSIFLVNIVGDAMRGAGIMWVFLLFLLPFIGIGLFLIGLAIRFVMALANPVPRLTVNRAAFVPGETVRLEWRFEGKAGRLQDLRIYLEGREEATYRRGTDTKTDKAVFATAEITTTTGKAAGEPGWAELRLPERTMHSFKSDNNKIIWALRLKGGIAWWPDVDEEFPFVITASRTPIVPPSPTSP